MNLRLVSIFFLFLITACTNTTEQVNALMNTHAVELEKAKNVEITYSDSARIKLKIMGETLVRNTDRKNPTEEFTDGIEVEFYGPRKNITSWLEAKYALRKEKERIIIVKDSVVLFNRKNEKLETSELIWDEETEKIRTNKFVRITQPEKGDTSYGYGFESDQEFLKFEIKNFSAKMNAKEISGALGIEDNKNNN